VPDHYTADEIDAPKRFWLDVQAVVWPDGGQEEDDARRRLAKALVQKGGS
jgi:hypothetical protein